MNMSEGSHIPIMPYTKMVGQKQLKLALELVYVAPRIGGVLICGERGTGKSTIVRAFAKMMDCSAPLEWVHAHVR
jgi:magnesium chelatase subunit I